MQKCGNQVQQAFAKLDNLPLLIPQRDGGPITHVLVAQDHVGNQQAYAIGVALRAVERLFEGLGGTPLSLAHAALQVVFVRTWWSKTTC